MKLTKKTKKSKKWFVATRGSYLPNTTAGWLTYVPYLGYLIGLTTIVCYERYGFVTSVLLLIPNWVTAAVVMNWVAAKHA